MLLVVVAEKIIPQSKAQKMKRIKIIFTILKEEIYPENSCNNKFIAKPIQFLSYLLFLYCSGVFCERRLNCLQK